MTLCGEIIRKITWLERKAETVVSQVCRIEALEQCSDWEDEGSEQCTQTKDEGYNQCSQTEDEGYSECCDWAPCSWFCDAWVWISNIVCVAWVWVSNIVCVVWSWVSKWVCRIVYWIYTTVCKLIVSIIFYIIRHTLELIFWIPCGFHQPTLDRRIKHIFVLMLENRSFDHMLGATPIRGRDAETGEVTQTLRRPDDTTNDVRDADGNVVTTCTVGTGQARSVGHDPGHEFGNTLIMLFGSPPTPGYPPYPPVDNSGFAQNYASTDPDNPCTIMLSYRGDGSEDGSADVPVITALAREFAVCDQWFSSMPGPTWPNRLFVHAASSAGLDDSPSVGDTVLDSLVQGFIFDNGTIYDLLDSENIDWAVYHGDALPQVLSLSGMDLTTIASHFHDMDDFESDLQGGSVANYVFIEPDYGDDITGSTYKCGNSQHPLDDITHGERLIKRVYEGLRNSPLWNESMLIVTYDEGGGFFDHARPGPTVPPGDSVTDPVNNHHDFEFNQLGVRVPAVVCSPWIPRNVVDHRGYEHASVPSTVERLWDLPAMTDRDAHARDLIDLLSLKAPRTDAPTTLPDAATPEAQCPDDSPTARGSAALSSTRPVGATLIAPARLASARQANPAAITSTAAAFFQVALRRDLQLAPKQERPAIYAQARRMQTMGEVGEYTTLVLREIERWRRTVTSRATAPARRRKTPR